MAAATASLYALTERDYERLARSTIPRPIADQFCFRVDDIEGATQVGQRLTAERLMRGIIFRYFSPWGGHERERRLRRDVPDASGDGKYIGPPDRPPLLFFPLLVNDEQFRAWLEDSAIPIVFVEGEKKALALMRIALANAVGGRPPFIVIGLAGVWCWKRKNGPLPDFDLIPWRSRQVSIFFDSNVHTNAKVRSARQALADELHHNRSAKVFFVEMPHDCELNGPDDLAYAHGDEAVLDCIEQAKPAIKPTAQPQKETIEERIRRGVFLRAAVANAQAAPDASELAKQTLGAKVWRRLAVLWAQAGKLEAEERDLLFTLHAMSDGEDEFDFYYLDLYRLLFPCDSSELDADGRLTSSARQRIRRRFDNLERAEQQGGIQFAIVRKGSRDDDGHHYPSHIRLLSLG
ncbi:MAG: hypothetical protein V7641_5036 [Blastocatellia bacterium]